MEIIVKPIITEKFTQLAETAGRYGFIVNKQANKLEIKNAVQSMYGVKVAEVNTQRYIGKVKTRYNKGGFVEGIANRCKKAIVTLEKGEAIDFYSNI